MPRRSAPLLVLLLLTGCSAHANFQRSVLPDDLRAARPAIDETQRTPIDAERVRLTRDYLAIHVPQLLDGLPAGDGTDRVAAIAFVPRMIVVHYTAIPTLDGTLRTFAPLEISSDRELIRKNGLLNVGIQFVVDRDGTIFALYPETAIARHVIGLNQVAIGIENVGDGDLGERGARAPLTEAQLTANVALVRWLAAKYPSIDYLIGHQEYRQVEDPRHPAHALFHEEIATYRTEKSDPGARFLKQLRKELRRPNP